MARATNTRPGSDVQCDHCRKPGKFYEMTNISGVRMCSACAMKLGSANTKQKERQSLDEFFGD